MATILREGRPEAGRRIGRGVLDARHAALRIEEDARAEAARLVEAARVEADAIARAAAARGREAGLAEVTELRARAAAERDRWLAAAHDEVLAIALEVARRIVGAAAERDPEVAVRSAARALDAAQSRGTLVVRVSPRDHAAVLAAEPLLSSRRGVAVVADAAVPAGGAIVDSDHGRIVASLEAQVAALGRALTRAP
jgi:flagellar assembly protein FliH